MKLMQNLILLLATAMLIGAAYYVYNHVITDNVATHEQLSTMQQNFDERLRKAKHERSVIKKNQNVLKRKIDSVLWRQKLILSEQDIMQLKIDSLQSDMDAVHDKLNTLKLGQRIIHKEVRGQKSETFLEKLMK